MTNAIDKRCSFFRVIFLDFVTVFFLCYNDKPLFILTDEYEQFWKINISKNLSSMVLNGDLI